MGRGGGEGGVLMVVCIGTNARNVRAMTRPPAISAPARAPGARPGACVLSSRRAPARRRSCAPRARRRARAARAARASWRGSRGRTGSARAAAAAPSAAGCSARRPARRAGSTTVSGAGRTLAGGSCDGAGRQWLQWPHGSVRSSPKYATSSRTWHSSAVTSASTLWMRSISARSRRSKRPSSSPASAARSPGAASTA